MRLCVSLNGCMCENIVRSLVHPARVWEAGVAQFHTFAMFCSFNTSLTACFREFCGSHHWTKQSSFFTGDSFPHPLYFTQAPLSWGKLVCCRNLWEALVQCCNTTTHCCEFLMSADVAMANDQLTLAEPPVFVQCWTNEPRSVWELLMTQQVL